MAAHQSGNGGFCGNFQNAPPMVTSRSQDPATLAPPRRMTDFLENHLSEPPLVENVDTERFRQALVSQPTLEQLCVTLTEIAKLIFDLTVAPTEADDIIKFIDHQHVGLTGHPHNKAHGESDGGIPDVFGTRSRFYEQYNISNGSRTTKNHHFAFPWHFVETLVEKQATGSLRDQSTAQLATYMTSVLIARPDLMGLYGLWTSAERYLIMWTDWTGSYNSPSYAWENIQPLFAYIASLYRPPEAHSFRDSTVCLADGPTQSVRPLWKFPSIFGQAAFEIIYALPPYGRGTRVYREVCSDDEAPFIVKDVFISNKGRRFHEAIMLHKVHHFDGQPSPVRGLVRGIPLDLPNLTTPTWPAESNQNGEELVSLKTRMLYFDSGTSISNARSMHELLVSMSDAIQVYRTAVERGVLHRNINPGAVYCQPKFMSSEKIKRYQSSLPPHCEWLIAEPYRSVCPANYGREDATPRPQCLLADFGLSCHYTLDPVGGS